MIIGVLVRLLAWSNTHVVNPDGTLYITQAKALFYGQKEALYCGFTYLANYSLMIAGAHWILEIGCFPPGWCRCCWLCDPGTALPSSQTIRRSSGQCALHPPLCHAAGLCRGKH